MKINNRKISINSPPFIVAEISANHNNNLNRALKLIDEAKKAGADAVKLQTYTADTITLKTKKREFLISDKESLWKGKYLHDLYKKGSTPWSWHKELFNRAKKNRIICFSSPFDETAVDFLEKFNVPAYKIASFENNHIPLVKKIIKTKKPIIISTGATHLKEIYEIIKVFRRKKFKNFALLKCTSSYPASVKESNIETIIDLRKRFKTEIGLSDHTPGIGAAVASISFGASIIEKHFTLNKKSGGLDDSFSMDANELNNLVIECKRAWQSKGKIFYGVTKSEKKSLIFKRSIYTSKKIKKGELLSKKNIKVIRPNLGLHPKFYEKILGKKVLKDLDRATALKKSHFTK